MLCKCSGNVLIGYYYSRCKLYLNIKMCTIRFSIELNTFQIDDDDLTTGNICEKSAHISKMDDASVSHPPVYSSFLGYY